MVAMSSALFSTANMSTILNAHSMKGLGLVSLSSAYITNYTVGWNTNNPTHCIWSSASQQGRQVQQTNATFYLSIVRCIILLRVGNTTQMGGIVSAIRAYFGISRSSVSWLDSSCKLTVVNLCYFCQWQHDVIRWYDFILNDIINRVLSKYVSSLK